MPADRAPIRPFHAVPPAEAAAEYRTVPAAGLSDEEASARLSVEGLNQLPPPPRTSVLRIMGDQLRSVIVLLLVVAVLVSLFSGEWLQAAAIAAALAINAALGTVTELRARRAIEALLDLDVQRAVVLRSRNCG